MAKTEKTTSLGLGSLVKSTADIKNIKSEMYDPKHGYTDDMETLQRDLRRYARFIATLVRLRIVPIRHAQILSSNYSQKRFEELRDGGSL